jgi:hypothetical protein
VSDAPNPAGSFSGAAERIRQLLVTAESVAEDIRREATEEAERYLAERRREADGVIAARKQHFEQALEVVRAARPELERLLADVAGALERAVAEPVAEPTPAARPAPAADGSAAAKAAQPQSESEPAPEAVAPQGASHVRQRALIRATQLAVQGAERPVVLETLEREFELDDAGSIVDEILGS